MKSSPSGQSISNTRELLNLLLSNTLCKVRFYTTYLSERIYTHLPRFSQFLLTYHLEALTRDQIQLAFEVELPLLKQLKAHSAEQLFAINLAAVTQFLEALSQNKAQEMIETSLQRWEKDQLEVISQRSLVGEDITLMHYIRAKSLRKFIPLFTTNVTTSLELADELEGFFMGWTTASVNTYLRLLKDEISSKETELLKAQSVARIGNFEWDPNTGTTNPSPELYRILELEPGCGFPDFLNQVHPEDKRLVEEGIAKTVKEGTAEFECRFIAGHKIKYLWSRSVTVQDEKGKSPKIVGTIQDISERKQSELELLEKTKALERSNQSLEQFAYAASHDLKEPMRKMQVFLERLKTGLMPRLSGEEVSLLERIEKAGDRMTRLVDDLLEYSHVSVRPRELEEVDLNDKIKRVLEDLELTIQEKGADIQVESLPCIYGHRIQLQQLFQNLISNALKYSKEEVPPVIEITCSKVKGASINADLAEAEKAKDFYFIEVKDNGIGFEAEYAEKIFQVFQRLHGKFEYSGTGVGLAIARKVVENHNGYILAESEPGKGARFKVYLPVS